MESYNTIIEYSKKLNIEPSALVYAKDSLSLEKLSGVFNGAPEILIFNKSKQYLSYKSDSITCNASIDYILKNICNTESIPNITRKKIEFQYLLKLLDNHNNALQALSDTTIDFIVFANFAKYVPKVNKSHIVGWNKELREHNGNCKTKIIYVNMDFLESWGIPKSSLPTFKLSANTK